MLSRLATGHSTADRQRPTSDVCGPWTICSQGHTPRKWRVRLNQSASCPAPRTKPMIALMSSRRSCTVCLQPPIGVEMRSVHEELRLMLRGLSDRDFWKVWKAQSVSRLKSLESFAQELRRSSAYPLAEISEHGPRACKRGCACTSLFIRRAVGYLRSHKSDIRCTLKTCNVLFAPREIWHQDSSPLAPLCDSDVSPCEPPQSAAATAHTGRSTTPSAARSVNDPLTV
jgi:hypothetical protein